MGLTNSEQVIKSLMRLGWWISSLCTFQVLRPKDRRIEICAPRIRGQEFGPGVVIAWAAKFYSHTLSLPMHFNVPFFLSAILVLARRASSSAKPSSIAEYFPPVGPDDVSKANELLKVTRHCTVDALKVQHVKSALLGEDHQFVLRVFMFFEDKPEEFEAVLAALEYPTCSAELVRKLDAVSERLVEPLRIVILSRVMMNIPWEKTRARIQASASSYDTPALKAIARMISKAVAHNKISLAKYLLCLKVVGADPKSFGVIASAAAINLVGQTLEGFSASGLLQGIASMDKEGHLTTEMLKNLKRLGKRQPKGINKSFVSPEDDFLKHPLIDRDVFKDLVLFSIQAKNHFLLRDLIKAAGPHEIDTLESTLAKDQQVELCRTVLDVEQISDLKSAWNKVYFHVILRRDRHDAWYERHATPIFKALELLSILPSVLIQITSEYAASQEIGSQQFINQFTNILSAQCI